MPTCAEKEVAASRWPRLRAHTSATGCRQLRGHLADHIRLSAAGGLPRKRAEGLTQTAAAKRLGIAQPHVLELKNYKLSRFSS